MRLSTLTVCAAALVSGVSLPAHASDGDWGLNGTYTATSNGEWSKTNERFQDEASLRSTWTISTVCSYPSECTGTVTSDFGWTAPIYQNRRCVVRQADGGELGAVPRRHRGRRAPGLSVRPYDTRRCEDRSDLADPGRRGPDDGPQRRLRHQQAPVHQHALQARESRLSERTFTMRTG